MSLTIKRLQSIIDLVTFLAADLSAYLRVRFRGVLIISVLPGIAIAAAIFGVGLLVLGELHSKYTELFAQIPEFQSDAKLWHLAGTARWKGALWIAGGASLVGLTVSVFMALAAILIAVCSWAIELVKQRYAGELAQWEKQASARWMFKINMAGALRLFITLVVLIAVALLSVGADASEEGLRSWLLLVVGVMAIPAALSFALMEVWIWHRPGLPRRFVRSAARWFAREGAVMFFLLLGLCSAAFVMVPPLAIWIFRIPLVRAFEPWETVVGRMAQLTGDQPPSSGIVATAINRIVDGSVPSFKDLFSLIGGQTSLLAILVFFILVVLIIRPLYLVLPVQSGATYRGMVGKSIACNSACVYGFIGFIVGNTLGWYFSGAIPIQWKLLASLAGSGVVWALFRWLRILWGRFPDEDP